MNRHLWVPRPHLRRSYVVGLLSQVVLLLPPLGMCALAVISLVRRGADSIVRRLRMHGPGTEETASRSNRYRGASPQRGREDRRGTLRRRRYPSVLGRYPSVLDRRRTPRTRCRKPSTRVRNGDSAIGRRLIPDRRISNGVIKLQVAALMSGSRSWARFVPRVAQVRDTRTAATEFTDFFPGDALRRSQSICSS